MKIIKIQQLKYKIKVVHDLGEPFYLDPETVYMFGLRKNDDITDEKLREILGFDEFIRVKQTAFRLLARRSHSKKELVTKLIGKEFSKNAASDVTDYLEENGYLDDSYFAELYIKQRMNRKYGFDRIKRELFEKGIENTIITRYELLYSQDKKNEINIEIVAEKKLKEIQNKVSEPLKIKARLYNYLVNRGFQRDLIFRTIEKLLKSNND